MITTSDTGTTFEERLRRELLAAHAEQFGDDGGAVTASPGRRPRRASRLVVAAAAVVVVAAASSLAVTLRSGGDEAPTDATLVVHRTQVALADATAAGDIGYDHMVMTENSSGAVSYSSDDWSSSSEGRTETFGTDGTLWSEQWHDGTSVGSPVLVINYGLKRYGEGKASSEWQGQTDGYAQVNQQITDGAYTVSGPTTVDGVSALELAQTFPNGSVTDIWVDATTYFPVRWVNINSVVTQSWDFTWSPSTPANMAELAPPPVPAGFTQAPLPRVLARSLVPPVSNTGATTLPAASTTVPAATTSVPAATTTVP
jgi:hypothetical protein